MKEKEDKIDAFFKDYIESLPDFNLTEEMQSKLQESIFRKLSENKTKKVESNFTAVFNLFFSKKLIFPKIAFASILLIISIYVFYNNKKENETNFDLSNAKPNIIQKQDLDNKKGSITKNNDEFIFSHELLSTLNYDLTTRSLNNDYKLEDEVWKYVEEVLIEKNLKFTSTNKIITTEEFVYKNRISYLQIILNVDNKELIFKLFYTNTIDNDNNRKSINPKLMVQQIESKILNLAIIE